MGGVNELVVIGHVGRFSPQKNHKFIVEIFAKVYAVCENARLLLIGQGELENSIHARIRELSLDDAVCHIRNTPHVNQYMQAMDCFLFPSIYEGLALTLLESQAAGLPTLVSEEIPQEAYISDLVYQCQLNQGRETWAKVILQMMERPVERCRYADIINQSGYSIRSSAMEIEKVYEGFEKCS